MQVIICDNPVSTYTRKTLSYTPLPSTPATVLPTSGRVVESFANSAYNFTLPIKPEHLAIVRWFQKYTSVY